MFIQSLMKMNCFSLLRTVTYFVLWIIVFVASTHGDVDHMCSSVSNRFAKPKIAVIGAGIGGASTVHYLRSLFGDNDGELCASAGCEIDVYEAADRVGGRLAVANVSGQLYETGGSIIHPRNHYMVEFVKLLGLERRQSPAGRFGVFDGEEYVYMESDWTVVNFAKLLWRYGACVLRLQSFVDDMMSYFSNIYSMQDRGESFETVEELLSAMNPLYVNLTRTTARDYLRSRDFSELFIDELFTAVTRVNYGQSAELSAFVGTVALAGVQSGLWSIKGGNYQVPERLFEAAKVNMIFAKVTRIALRQDTRFHVHSMVATGTSFNKFYDMVFVCTPLTDGMSGIKFSGFPADQHLERFDGKYQRTVATLVQGSLNTTTLRLISASDVSDVLTTSGVSYFNSMGLNYPVQGTEAAESSRSSKDVWKVFSPQPLTEVELDSLYAERTEMHVSDWLAYPHYDVRLEPQRHHGQFLLYPKLYYTNCIEWAASAMEMSAIAGRNVATLAFNQWIEHFKKNDAKQEPSDECKTAPTRKEL